MHEAIKQSFLYIVAVGVLFIGSMGVAAQVQAQFEGVAEYLPITEEEVRDGDIITFHDGEYRRAATPYDTNLIGAINFEPAVALSTTGAQNTHAVVIKNTAHVNVSTTNGAIAAGDFITSSEQPGIGMKATRPGTIIGIALEPFESDQPDTVGQIPIEISVTYKVPLDTQAPGVGQSIISEALRLITSGAEAAAQEPNRALRFIIAALLFLISSTFGFLVFGRSATNGIIAIGRNPLARRSIIVAVSFNIFVTIAFVAAGLVLGFIILAV